MSSSFYRAVGVGFTLLLVGIGWLVVAVFQQDLADTRTVSVRTERAGLMMEPGAGVEMRGVNIGRVKSVRSVDGGAELTLAIEADRFGLIPANVTAVVIPPTAFGAKYVSLQPPRTSAGPIAEGAVISGEHVTVEINQTFDHLMGVLDAAQPAKVNSALNAMAGALDGRGAEMGELMSQVNTYLLELNKAVPQLATDIERAQDVLATYRKATPDFIEILQNVTVTSETLTAEQASLDRLLMKLGSSADHSGAFLSKNEERLVSTVNLLAPTTRLLADYSPMLSCTIKGMAYFNQQSIPALGGNQIGVSTNTNLYPSLLPYKNPENLPRVNASNSPQCLGLPVVGKDRIKDPHIHADTGANPWETAPTTTLDGLSTTLFGALAGLVAK